MNTYYSPFFLLFKTVIDGNSPPPSTHFIGFRIWKSKTWCRVCRLETKLDECFVFFIHNEKVLLSAVIQSPLSLSGHKSEYIRIPHMCELIQKENRFRTKYSVRTILLRGQNYYNLYQRQICLAENQFARLFSYVYHFQMF